MSDVSETSPYNLNNRKGFRATKQPTKAKVLEKFNQVASEVEKNKDMEKSLMKLVLGMANKIASLEQQILSTVPSVSYGITALGKLLCDKGIILQNDFEDYFLKEEVEFLKVQEVQDNQRLNLFEVDRPIADGDAVVLSYQGSLDGVNIRELKCPWMQTIVGTPTINIDYKQLTHGLGDALIGMSKGETKKVPVVFTDESSPDPTLVGKTVDFEIQVFKVKEHRPVVQS